MKCRCGKCGQKVYGSNKAVGKSLNVQLCVSSHAGPLMNCGQLFDDNNDEVGEPLNKLLCSQGNHEGPFDSCGEHILLSCCMCLSFNFILFDDFF